MPLARAVFSFEVRGRENIPRHGAYIAIANHLRWVDWLTILIVLPVEPRVHFLADPSGLLTMRLKWWLVRKVGGYVPVDLGRHGDPALYEHVQRCLREGGAVCIFPEGRYGEAEGTMLPFKKGFAHFGIQAQAPVLPLALSGTRDVWLRKRILVTIGAPIDPAGCSPDSLTEAAEQAMSALLPAYEEPPGPKPLRHFLTYLFD